MTEELKAIVANKHGEYVINAEQLRNCVLASDVTIDTSYQIKDGRKIPLKFKGGTFTDKEGAEHPCFLDAIVRVKSVQQLHIDCGPYLRANEKKIKPEGETYLIAKFLSRSRQKKSTVDKAAKDLPKMSRLELEQLKALIAEAEKAQS